MGLRNGLAMPYPLGHGDSSLIKVITVSTNGISGNICCLKCCIVEMAVRLADQQQSVQGKDHRDAWCGHRGAALT